MMGPKLSYSCKLIVGFLGCGTICLIIPFVAKIGQDEREKLADPSDASSTNFWIEFCTLLVFGWFSGMVQGTTYTMAAAMGF